MLVVRMLDGDYIAFFWYSSCCCSSMFCFDESVGVCGVCAWGREKWHEDSIELPTSQPPQITLLRWVLMVQTRKRYSIITQRCLPLSIF